MSRRDEILAGLLDNVLWGRAEPVVALTQEGLSLGLTPDEMLWQGLIPGLEEVGRRFEVGDFFVPEMLIAARAMQGALNILKPLMVQGATRSLGTCVMGTVKGDMHDIGKNLCDIMLEGAGFKVIDLGVNVSPARFVEAVQQHHPDVLGMSAFLTTTMPMLKVTLQALEQAGVRQQVRVMVGGAPVTPEYAQKVGADGFARDASKTVALAKRLIGDASPTELPENLTAAVAAITKLMGAAEPEEH
jgi:5-methyltetrahydrofolate--homocysteine methyltransferase